MGKKTIIILSLSGIMVFSLLMFKKDSQTGHDAQEQNKAMIETGRHLFLTNRSTLGRMLEVVWSPCRKADTG